jgi:hypothetical protein
MPPNPSPGTPFIGADAQAAGQDATLGGLRSAPAVM